MTTSSSGSAVGAAPSDPGGDVGHRGTRLGQGADELGRRRPAPPPRPVRRPRPSPRCGAATSPSPSRRRPGRPRPRRRSRRPARAAPPSGRRATGRRRALPARWPATPTTCPASTLISIGASTNVARRSTASATSVDQLRRSPRTGADHGTGPSPADTTNASGWGDRRSHSRGLASVARADRVGDARQSRPTAAHRLSPGRVERLGRARRATGDGRRRRAAASAVPAAAARSPCRSASPATGA